MSKQAFAVRQGERELGCLWQMETIRVSLFHVSCGRNFSMLLSNRSKRCQRVRDEVSTVFIKLRRYTGLGYTIVVVKYGLPYCKQGLKKGVFPTQGRYFRSFFVLAGSGLHAISGDVVKS